MEDMPESDLLPKNMIKVYIFHYIFNHHMEKGREKGRRGGRGEEVRGEGRRWREYIIHRIVTVSLSLQLCEEELKN